jgi:23S rRNA (cytosine1962-C5)-methyltransferase
MFDVVLKPGRDRSLRRRHPWLLDGSVERVVGSPAAGDWVRVQSASGELLGYGFYSPASRLRVRVACFGKEPPSEDWLERRIAEAVARRDSDPTLTGLDALRLVNAEGDGLPGLVADRYGDVVVGAPDTSTSTRGGGYARIPGSRSGLRPGAATGAFSSVTGWRLGTSVR